MNATLAKKLLEPIPPTQFITSAFSIPHKQQCCAVGHLQRLTSKNPEDYSENNCRDFKGGLFQEATPSRILAPDVFNFARITVQQFFEEKFSLPDTDLSDVNNSSKGYFGNYFEKDPKDRVIHLLNDMIADGY